MTDFREQMIVGIVDPEVPGHVLKPQADGSLNVNVGVPVTATLGQLASSPETSTVYNGATALTPHFAGITAGSNGDNTIVAGVGGKKIRVLAYVLTSNANVNAKWQSSVAGDLTGLLYLGAHSCFAAGFNPSGWFETVAGEDLQLNLSGAQDTGGHLTYVLI